LPNINQLIPDIYELVQSKGGWNVQVDYMARRLGEQFNKSHEIRRGLRLSGLGPKCPRALWYSANHPELAEPLPPWAVIKYTYGHIIEALIIELAKSAGHDVQGEQDEIILDGVMGHRDCVIDGAIVDVKSASSLGFKKFKDKTIAQSDDFGYLDQLDAYVVGSVMANDPLVIEQEKGYNIAVDKTLGHLCLYEHYVRPVRIRERIKLYKEIVQQPHAPDCQCEVTQPDNTGNIILGTKASYSPYKRHCFPGLKTILYSTGPKDFAKVVKWPMSKGQPLPELCV